MLKTWPTPSPALEFCAAAAEATQGSDDGNYQLLLQFFHSTQPLPLPFPLSLSWWFPRAKPKDDTETQPENGDDDDDDDLVDEDDDVVGVEVKKMCGMFICLW